MWKQQSPGRGKHDAFWHIVPGPHSSSEMQGEQRRSRQTRLIGQAWSASRKPGMSPHDPSRHS